MGIHTRFASESCSARTPGRDVKSVPGKSVDVRDSLEDRVSVMMTHQNPPGRLAWNKMYPPVILYATAPPVRGSSFERGRRFVRCPSE